MPKFPSISHFTQWLGTLEPKSTFCYGSTQDCLIARYYKAHGKEYIVSLFAGKSTLISVRDKIEWMACAAPSGRVSEVLALAKKMRKTVPFLRPDINGDSWH